MIINILLYISVFIEGVLFSFMIWRFYHKEYWIALVVIWLIPSYFLWFERLHANDYAISIPNQEHITYKVFYGKDQYMVRHRINYYADQGKFLNQDWSKDACNGETGNSTYDVNGWVFSGWVFKLDGNFVSNSYLWFHPGICGTVQKYLDEIDAKQRRKEWGYK